MSKLGLKIWWHEYKITNIIPLLSYLRSLFITFYNTLSRLLIQVHGPISTLVGNMRKTKWHFDEFHGLLPTFQLGVDPSWPNELHWQHNSAWWYDHLKQPGFCQRITNYLSMTWTKIFTVLWEVVMTNDKGCRCQCLWIFVEDWPDFVASFMSMWNMVSQRTSLNPVVLMLQLDSLEISQGISNQNIVLICQNKKEYHWICVA